MAVPRPYELYFKFKDGRREILDISANKKFNKVYPVDEIVRLEL